MKKLFLLIAIFILTGCATVSKDFTARTVASANKDGFSYDSTKNQESLEAMGEIDPETGKMKFSVKTTATTPEAAIAAASAANAAVMQAISELLKTVMPLITKGASVVK